MLGLTWTGGILDLRDKPETADIEYIIPEDGTLFWLDTWVVLADAPHPRPAYAFLNFIHEPEIQAKETETNRYATPNDEAKKFVAPEILNDPTVFVPDERHRPSLEGATGRLDRPATRRDLGGVQLEASAARLGAVPIRCTDGSARRSRYRRANGTPRRAGRSSADGRAPAAGVGLVPDPAGPPDRDRHPVQLRRPQPDGRVRRRLHAPELRHASSGARTRSSRASCWRSSARVLCLAGRSAARVLHRDTGRGSESAVHHPAGHPVLDELPDPDLRLDR